MAAGNVFPRYGLKVCGLTAVADLIAAGRAGADFFGLIINAPHSPRSLPLPVAARLARLCPEAAVAVCIHDDPACLLEVISVLHPRALQLHQWNEQLMHRLTPLCPVWPVIGLPPAGEGDETTCETLTEKMTIAAQLGAEAVVLDTAVAGRSGGTGRVSDWQLAARAVATAPVPVILAGGLNPHNIAEAFAVVQPAAVDISSGLEAVPGRKDPAKMQRLAEVIAAVRSSSS